jgi:hypothetical protein
VATARQRCPPALTDIAPACRPLHAGHFVAFCSALVSRPAGCVPLLTLHTMHDRFPCSGPAARSWGANLVQRRVSRCHAVLGRRAHTFNDS